MAVLTRSHSRGRTALQNSSSYKRGSIEASTALHGNDGTGLKAVSLPQTRSLPKRRARQTLSHKTIPLRKRTMALDDRDVRSFGEADSDTPRPMQQSPSPHAEICSTPESASAGKQASARCSPNRVMPSQGSSCCLDNVAEAFLMRTGRPFIMRMAAASRVTARQMIIFFLAALYAVKDITTKITMSFSEVKMWVSLGDVKADLAQRFTGQHGVREVLTRRWRVCRNTWNARSPARSSNSGSATPFSSSSSFHSDCSAPEGFRNGINASLLLRKSLSRGTQSPSQSAWRGRTAARRRNVREDTASSEGEPKSAPKVRPMPGTPTVASEDMNETMEMTKTQQMSQTEGDRTREVTWCMLLSILSKKITNFLFFSLFHLFPLNVHFVFLNILIATLLSNVFIQLVLNIFMLHPPTRWISDDPVVALLSPQKPLGASPRKPLGAIATWFKRLALYAMMLSVLQYTPSASNLTPDIKMLISTSIGAVSSQGRDFPVLSFFIILVRLVVILSACKRLTAFPPKGSLQNFVTAFAVQIMASAGCICTTQHRLALMQWQTSVN